MKPVLSLRHANFLHHYPAMPLPRLQADFSARIADPQGVRAIFEPMPGVFFFMKAFSGAEVSQSCGCSAGRVAYAFRASPPRLHGPEAREP